MRLFLNFVFDFFFAPEPRQKPNKPTYNDLGGSKETRSKNKNGIKLINEKNEEQFKIIDIKKISQRTTVRGFSVPRPKRLRRRPFPAFPELRVGLGLVTADGLPGIPGLLDSSLLARTRGGESQRNANCVDLSSRRELVGTVDAFLSAKPVAPGTGPSVDGTTPCTERLLEYRWSDHGVFLVSCRLSSSPKEDTRGTQCGRFLTTGRRPLTKPRPWLLR